MKIWKVILAVLAIFGAGVVAGLVTAKYTVASSQPSKWWKGEQSPLFIQRREFFDRMKTELQLSPEQIQKIEKILKESQTRTAPLLDIIQPVLAEEYGKVKSDIRAVLTPEQKQKYEEMFRRRPPHYNKPGEGKPGEGKPGFPPREFRRPGPPWATNQPPQK